MGHGGSTVGRMGEENECFGDIIATGGVGDTALRQWSANKAQSFEDLFERE